MHREVIVNRPRFQEWLEKTFCIRFTDGTTLELNLHPCKPRERVAEKKAYSSLICDCFYHNVDSVSALSEIKMAQRLAKAVQP